MYQVNQDLSKSVSASSVLSQYMGNIRKSVPLMLPSTRIHVYCVLLSTDHMYVMCYLSYIYRSHACHVLYCLVMYVYRSHACRVTYVFYVYRSHACHVLPMYLMYTGHMHVMCYTVLLCSCAYAVFEITVGLRTLSDHFDHLSDPKMLGSDIWLSTIKGPLP